MTTKIKIMVRACNIRLNNGELLDDIIKSYPKLNELEINEIKEAINNGKN